MSNRSQRRCEVCITGKYKLVLVELHKGQVLWKEINITVWIFILTSSCWGQVSHLRSWCALPVAFVRGNPNDCRFFRLQVTKVIFSANGNKLAAVDGDGLLSLWQASHGLPIRKPFFVSLWELPFESFLISTDGKNEWMKPFTVKHSQHRAFHWGFYLRLIVSFLFEHSYTLFGALSPLLNHHLIVKGK